MPMTCYDTYAKHIHAVQRSADFIYTVMTLLVPL